MIPCGLNTMMSTMAAPKASMRYSEKALRYSGISMRMNAPTMTPTMEPIPPSTTMERIMADSMKVKLAGFMNVVLAARMHPTKPAHVAPRAKALSLVPVLSMPMAWHATSSSRRAIQALPMRESLSLFTTSMVKSTRAIMM